MGAIELLNQFYGTPTKEELREAEREAQDIKNSGRIMEGVKFL